jgi:hypothetical protein
MKANNGSKACPSMILSGLAGLVLAPLVYLFAARVGGILRGWVGAREAEVIIFGVLLVIALAEIPAMVFALRTMCRSSVSRWFLYAATSFYVAFAAVYAGILNLLFGESFFSALLASLSVLRWVSSWWIH